MPTLLPPVLKLFEAFFHPFWVGTNGRNSTHQMHQTCVSHRAIKQRLKIAESEKIKLPSKCSGRPGSLFSLGAATLMLWFYTNADRSLLSRSGAHVNAGRISGKAAQRDLLPSAQIRPFIPIVLPLLKISLDEQLSPSSLRLSLSLSPWGCVQEHVNKRPWNVAADVS